MTTALNPPLLCMSWIDCNTTERHVCLSCIFDAVFVLSALFFPYDRFGIYASGHHALLLFLNVLLNIVSVNITGVRDKAPWRSVCDLSPKTISATGMLLLESFWGQYRFLSGIQASPVWTSSYYWLAGWFWSTDPVKTLYPSAKLDCVMQVGLLSMSNIIAFASNMGTVAEDLSCIFTLQNFRRKCLRCNVFSILCMNCFLRVSFLCWSKNGDEI